jgi:predicted RNA-binding Zn ribbon-like protein
MQEPDVSSVVPIEELTFEAGRLCLNFTNTAEWHASDQPTEHLHSYGDLVRWAQQAEILTGDRAEYLVEESNRRSEEATQVLDQAIILRESIYRIFSAVAADRSPKPDDLDSLNIALSESLRWLQVSQTTEGFTWTWGGDAAALDQMLWPVARSAARLLTSEELDRVRECTDDRGCGYLFMDTSRNRSRKWCDMRGCGNRAKARRHYRRVQADNNSNS